MFSLAAFVKMNGAEKRIKVPKMTKKCFLQEYIISERVRVQMVT